VSEGLPCFDASLIEEVSLPSPNLARDNREGTSPKLSVIVPATDRRQTLPRCLAALHQARGIDDQLIVVDRCALPGPASARNHGATRALHPILVFVDADIEVSPHALTLIRERFAADPDLMAVFGSYDDDPEARNVVSMFRNLLHHYVHQESAGSVDSFWAGLGAVRRSAFHEVGGFDRRILLASVEDIELGARLVAAGRIELDPAIQGKHLKRWTFAGMLRTDFRRRGVPWTRLALRGRATRSGLNLAWRHRVSAATCLLILASVLRRRSMTALCWLGVMCSLNRRFYRSLAGWGPRYLVSGVALHMIHHLTSVLAFVVGALSMPWHSMRLRMRLDADA
jgi:glycosyltransferase involved in cell wall biosynthesis